MVNTKSKILIVESPAKAKTISKYLGGEYKVVASVGHIRDLPKSNKEAVDIEGGYIPHYQIVPGKEKIVKELKSLTSKATEVILATDPDREGEAIAWHIAEAVGLKGKEKTKRVVFHEITKEAILEAMKNPGTIDENLKEAQEARRVLDRLVGYDLSGLIWKKVRYGLSAGRVQSPALRIIMEREREIRKFEPQKFWVVTANLQTQKKEEAVFTSITEPTEEKEVERILEYGNNNEWSVKNIKESQVKRAPRAPFITSTLQQTASSRLGISPAQTMRAAQGLYEKGLITYMRTDSTNLGSSAIKQIEKEVKKRFGADQFKSRVFSKKSKNSQEAHEAIRPTNFSINESGVSREEKNLYRLIWQRTIASQMVEAQIARVKVLAQSGDGKTIPDFSLNGSRCIFEGWIQADPDARKEDVEVPKLSIGDPLTLLEIQSEEKETQPPSRYSEAGLVKELEKRGIGRPSTYASIIKTIQDRGYVEKINKALHPTDTGDVVSSFLEEHFSEYISDFFTAKMEDTLDEIAEGRRKYLEVLEEFYTPLRADIKSKESIEKITNLGDADAKHKCPKCKSGMIIKLGKSGKFLSCNKFPDCQGARTIDGEAIEEPKEIGEDCQECKGGRLIERHGKFGKFIGCNRYPKCKYIRQDENSLEKSGVKCSLCKNGDMVKRHGRFGEFYSCENYPKCRFAIKAKPTGKICPECESLMMEGTKTIPERCSNKDCKMHNPHKLEKKVTKKTKQ